MSLSQSMDSVNTAVEEEVSPGTFVFFFFFFQIYCNHIHGLGKKYGKKLVLGFLHRSDFQLFIALEPPPLIANAGLTCTPVLLLPVCLAGFACANSRSQLIN